MSVYVLLVVQFLEKHSKQIFYKGKKTTNLNPPRNPSFSKMVISEYPRRPKNVAQLIEAGPQPKSAICGINGFKWAVESSWKLQIIDWKENEV